MPLEITMGLFTKLHSKKFQSVDINKEKSPWKKNYILKKIYCDIYCDKQINPRKVTALLAVIRWLSKGSWNTSVFKFDCATKLFDTKQQWRFCVNFEINLLCNSDLNVETHYKVIFPSWIFYHLVSQFCTYSPGPVEGGTGVARASPFFWRNT